MKNNHLFVILSLALLASSVACASRSKTAPATGPLVVTSTPASATAAAPAVKSDESSAKNNAAKDNREFYRILNSWAKSDLKLKKDPRQIIATDLTCLMKLDESKGLKNGPQEMFECEYQLKSSDSKTVKKGRTRGESAEKMRNLLIGYSVAKGESGASTPYLGCDLIGAEVACDIAVQVDYRGP